MPALMARPPFCKFNETGQITGELTQRFLFENISFYLEFSWLADAVSLSLHGLSNDDGYAPRPTKMLVLV